MEGAVYINFFADGEGVSITKGKSGICEKLAKDTVPPKHEALKLKPILQPLGFSETQPTDTLLLG